MPLVPEQEGLLLDHLEQRVEVEPVGVLNLEQMDSDHVAHAVAEVLPAQHGLPKHKLFAFEQELADSLVLVCLVLVGFFPDAESSLLLVLSSLHELLPNQVN